MLKFLFNFYKIHFLGFDTIFAFIVSATTYYVFNRHGLFSPAVLTDNQVVGTLLQIHMGLLGFLIAVMTIIFGFTDGKKLEFFRQSNQYGTVMKIYLNAMKWLGVLAIFGFILLIISFQKETALKIWLILSLFLPLIKLWRCIWVAKEIFLLSVEKHS